MQPEFSTKSPLGRVKGLGASHEGTHHWWLQRVTAVALIPFTIWLVFSLASLAGAEREVVIMWFGHPLAALALAGSSLTALYHALLGTQVIIEDYVHTEWVRLVSLWAVKFLTILLMGLILVSIIIMVYIRFMGSN